MKHLIAIACVSATAAVSSAASFETIARDMGTQVVNPANFADVNSDAGVSNFSATGISGAAAFDAARTVDLGAGNSIAVGSHTLHWQMIGSGSATNASGTGTASTHRGATITRDSVATIVPLPQPAALAGLALVGLAGVRRRNG